MVNEEIWLKKTISFNKYYDDKTLRDITQYEFQKAAEMQQMSYLELEHAG
jgi:hypothetical protein